MEILLLIKNRAEKLVYNLLTILGLNKENSMYYIAGNDTLPAPLLEKEEAELLMQLSMRR